MRCGLSGIEEFHAVILPPEPDADNGTILLDDI